MSQSTVSVRKDDFEALLGYLGGLGMILRSFHFEEAENNHADIATGAMSLHPEGAVWEPLRFDGVRFDYAWDRVAANVEELRTRLLDGYER